MVVVVVVVFGRGTSWTRGGGANGTIEGRRRYTGRVGDASVNIRIIRFDAGGGYLPWLIVEATIHHLYIMVGFTTTPCLSRFTKEGGCLKEGYPL